MSDRPACLVELWWILQLSKLKVFGFGRLAQGSLDLGPRVIAVVGPNEAGKSTLLEALSYLTGSQTLAPMRRSRTRSVADNLIVVQGVYVLSADESSQFEKFDLEAVPRTAILQRTAGYPTRFWEISPPIQRSIARLALMRDNLQRELRANPVTAPDEDDSLASQVASAAEQVERLLDELTADTEGQDLQDKTVALLPDLKSLQALIGPLVLSEAARSSVGNLISWIEESDERPDIEKLLGTLVPSVLFFGAADREMPAAIGLSDEVVAKLPLGVRNLAEMAGLSIADLWADIQQGNRSAFETKRLAANKVLDAKFRAAWRQSDLIVQFGLSGGLLNIDVLQNGETVTPIDERSAGLRMYVALTAFLERQNLTLKPILLIDEAETHLHIDAQADLVSAFMRQDQVAKIIYTTHSPACLPPDLGTGVRAIIPSSENYLESTLENSFWRNSTGFSPLMIAMGAGAAAFSAARFVVLAEGASEMFLLPSLIRAATGLSELEYQIAPGLSEASAESYRGLDLEGAHVAFLVDGDTGGATIRAALENARIPKSKILTLDAITLEALVEPAIYAAEFVRLLRQWNPSATIVDPPEFAGSDDEPLPTKLIKWAEGQRRLVIPGKRDLASSIVENGIAVPTHNGAVALRKLHKALERALKIPKA